MRGYALKKWESTLNLCVHAHGYYVELIMKASRKDNQAPWYKFFYTYDPPFYLRVLPLVSRGYHAFALHLMNCDETMPIPVIAISWFWVVVNQEHRILLLHHTFCLMSPLFNCIFLKPFDMICRGHHRHFDFSQ